MKKTVAIYKCRLCGKKFETVHCGNRIVQVIMASLGLDDLTLQDNFHIQRVYPHLTHFCEDGSFGFADFLGFKMEEIDKGEEK